MAEAVGKCLKCGKTVFCDNGFLQGVVVKDGVVCFDCEENGGPEAVPGNQDPDD